MPKAYVSTRDGGPEVEVLTGPERPKPGPGDEVEDGHAPGRTVIEVTA
ncbi:hypothetical protein ACFUJY_18905 [Streptomyces sp. NPDC057249]